MSDFSFLYRSVINDDDRSKTMMPSEDILISGCKVASSVLVNLRVNLKCGLFSTCPRV